MQLVEQLSTVEESAEVEPLKEAAFDRATVVELCKTDLNFFASLVIPAIFTIFFPALHIKLWDILLDAVQKCKSPFEKLSDKFPQIAVGWPRGHAKTTLVKLFVIWCILFTTRKFILIVASNTVKAENILADIMDMLREPNIVALFGDYRESEELNRSDLKKFSYMGRTIILASLGNGSDPRGLNLKNERPDLIVMDDLQSKENSDSPTQSKALLSWMTSTLAKSKSPHGCIFIYIGNMFASQGCILKILKNNPNWLSVIVAGILADGSSLWPELRSKEELLEELRNDIAMGTPEVFFSEIMNAADSGVTSCFDITKVPRCPFSATDSIADGSFIIIDVALDKINSDDTTIIRYQVHDGKPVARDIIAEQLSPGATIKKALVWALTFGIPVIGVEGVAYQATLLFWFRQTCLEHGIEGIEFLELRPKNRTKNSRILTMFKALIAETLYLDDSIREKVFWEAAQFKPALRENTDNILDNLAYAEQMVQEHFALCMNPLSVESIEMETAKVPAFNSAF